MAAPAILGFDSASKGKWGGYGAGWYMQGPSPGYTLYSSLPTWLSSVTPPATRYTIALSAGDPRRLDFPPGVGGSTTGEWFGSSTESIIDVAAADGRAWLLSVYAIDNTAGRFHTVELWSFGGGGSPIATAASPIESIQGWWCRIRAVGSIRVRLAGGAYPQVMGLLFDPWADAIASAVPRFGCGHFAL